MFASLRSEIKNKWKHMTAVLKRKLPDKEHSFLNLYNQKRMSLEDFKQALDAFHEIWQLPTCHYQRNNINAINDEIIHSVMRHDELIFADKLS